MTEYIYTKSWSREWGLRERVVVVIFILVAIVSIFLTLFVSKYFVIPSVIMSNLSYSGVIAWICVNGEDLYTRRKFKNE